MPNDQQITALLADLQRSLDEAGLAGGDFPAGWRSTINPPRPAVCCWRAASTARPRWPAPCP